MQLSRKDIEEFQEVYEEDFGVHLPFDEAEMLANQIVELYWDLYSTPPEGKDNLT